MGIVASTNPDGGVRSFVAVLLEGTVLEELLVLQRWLRGRVPEGVRWSKAEQLHLTLVFLGDVAADRLSSLTSALDRIGNDREAFRLELRGVGAFPDLQRPRVIWVGLHGDLARLEELQHAVQAAAAGFGSHAEPREFHPHLTLGRLQRGTIAPRNLSEALAELPGPRTLSWTVRQLHLMRSELRSEGARHTVMSAIALRGPG